jgi:cytochrome c oxidase subunit 3
MVNGHVMVESALVDGEALRQHRYAGHLGMMVFITSEAMLFAGMFALYAGYRLAYPEDFARGVAANLRWVGSLNTYLLLISSWTLALALPRLRSGRSANALIGTTMVLGLTFLGMKTYEYARHIQDGLVPGTHAHGKTIFLALYYLMTGTHAIHIVAGLVLVGLAWVKAARGHPQRLEIAALYWHFVDLMWVFLWPLFYLVSGPRP